MQTFYWTTTEYHHTNSQTMTDYLENHLPDGFEVTFQDESYAEIRDLNTGDAFGIHASGNGDSFNHKIEFKAL